MAMCVSWCNVQVCAARVPVDCGSKHAKYKRTLITHQQLEPYPELDVHAASVTVINDSGLSLPALKLYNRFFHLF